MNFLSTIRLIFMSCILLYLFGCALTNSRSVSISPNITVNRNGANVVDKALLKVTAHKSANPSLVEQEISSDSIAEEIYKSLIQLNIFGNDSENAIVIDCTVEKIDLPNFGYSFPTTIVIRYTVKEAGGKIIFDESISSNGESDSASLIGYMRASRAIDVTLAKNVQYFIDSLKPALVAYNKDLNNNKNEVQKLVVNRIDTKIHLEIHFSNTLPQTNSIAVIIGNRNYQAEKQNVPDVDFAHNDADLMKRYVVEGLGYREGNIIDLRDATQANLISVFGNKDNPKGQLYGWLRPGESDVFVYYSGHGAPGLSNGQGYLLPVDANPNTVELNGYPLETLYANLGQLPAKSLTVVIDACFSGSSQAGSVVKNASAISLKRVDAKATLPNATILTAAGISEVASWDEEARLGLFTRHFLEGVTGKADQGNFGNGDGQVTLGELKNYLESEVTYMARRLYMREQHPQVSGEPKTRL